MNYVLGGVLACLVSFCTGWITGYGELNNANNLRGVMLSQAEQLRESAKDVERDASYSNELIAEEFRWYATKLTEAAQ